ncbi:MAG TPA: LUD domain-containing protein [Ktedonobacterales bacterium]|jgi:L-lactate dehydrogenase complex protein LldG|nr:LUD domain-containing protein [Ktedonobacterales bacterium]
MDEAAKEVILARIRATLAEAPEVTPTARGYLQCDERDRATILAELIDRLRDYKAIVERIEPVALLAAIATACSSHAIRKLVVPADAPAVWVPEGVETLQDDPPLTNEALDHSDAVLTGCAFAIAQTGTIVLDGGTHQGRRALSLVPDHHLCVVHAEQVVGIVPEGIDRLVAHPTRPITFISGPSATSDIELSRVEGVHGPRTLLVFLVEAVT